MPLKTETYLYPEMIRRRKTWPEAIAACGMKLSNSYRPQDSMARRHKKKNRTGRDSGREDLDTGTWLGENVTDPRQENAPRSNRTAGRRGTDRR